MVAAEVPAGFVLDPIDGEARTIEEWMITFQLLAVVLDPYTYESSWILDTAGRILSGFSGASVRAAFILACSPDEARQFLGPWAERVLTFADPDRAFVRACGLDSLPALVHVHQSRAIAGAAQGWVPAEWRAIAKAVATERHWSSPQIPAAGDPSPYAGSPALV